MAAFLDLSRTDAGLARLRPILAMDGEPEDVLRAAVGSIANKLHVRYLAHWLALLSQTLESSPARDDNVLPLRATS
jgi:hypothetical protein